MFLCLKDLHVVILSRSSNGLQHLPPPLFRFILLFITICCTGFYLQNSLFWCPIYFLSHCSCPLLHYLARYIPAVYVGFLDCFWNVMAQAQKPDFVFRRNERNHLNRRWRQFSRLLAAEVCASAVVMLDTQCSELVWRVLVTHSIRQFPLYFPFRASPCAITFQLHSTLQ